MLYELQNKLSKEEIEVIKDLRKLTNWGWGEQKIIVKNDGDIVMSQIRLDRKLTENRRKYETKNNGGAIKRTN